MSVKAAFATPYFSETESRQIGETADHGRAVWQSNLGPPFTIAYEPNGEMHLMEVAGGFVAFPHPHKTAAEIKRDRRQPYTPCRCAGDCGWKDAYPEEPCWGQVDKLDELDDGTEIHACMGHRETLDWCADTPNSRKYIPEDNGQTNDTAAPAAEESRS